MKSGPKCTTGIQNITQFVTKELKQAKSGGDNTTALKMIDIWSAQGVTWEEFANMFADTFAGMVQYGKRIELCNSIEAILDQDNIT